MAFYIASRSETSHKLVEEISLGDLMLKPGWIRMSIHPTTTNEEVQLVCDSIKSLAENHQDWAKDYIYDKNSNEFSPKNTKSFE